MRDTSILNLETAYPFLFVSEPPQTCSDALYGIIDIKLGIMLDACTPIAVVNNSTPDLNVAVTGISGTYLNIKYTVKAFGVTDRAISIPIVTSLSAAHGLDSFALSNGKLPATAISGLTGIYIAPRCISLHQKAPVLSFGLRNSVKASDVTKAFNVAKVSITDSTLNINNGFNAAASVDGTGVRINGIAGSGRGKYTISPYYNDTGSQRVSMAAAVATGLLSINGFSDDVQLKSGGSLLITATGARTDTVTIELDEV